MGDEDRDPATAAAACIAGDAPAWPRMPEGVGRGVAVIEIPGYTILGQIGKGGMATVYRARQVLLDREVGLKVMSPQLAADPVYSQRFLQEARMLAALNHPHIVQVYDIGETPAGLNYFSMQLLTGGDFATRLREGMSEAELVRVLTAVAQALSFAHARGYVHRDVTPANILFDAHDMPVLTDFGIARALAATSRITSAGLSIGTSQYMSPEQARGVEVDHRSDIYSLGVLCFEAVAGHPPFQGDDGFAVAFSHVHDPVPRLPDEAARWQPLIDRAMAKDPKDRFPDCAAFIEALREAAPDEFASVVASPVSTAAPKVAAAAARKPAAPARPPANATAGSTPRRGLPWVPIGLTLGAILSGGLLAWGLWGWMQPAPAPAKPPVSTQPAPRPTPAPAEPRPTPAEPLPVPEDAAPLPGESSELTAGVGPDGQPLPEHTVFDPVAELLRMGNANIRAERYVSPPVTNAVDRFKLALLIEPSNVEAQQGIAAVAKVFLDQAAAIDRDADLAGWLQRLQQADAVAAQTTLGAPIVAETRKAREAQVASLVERGQTAIREWRRAEALAAFDAALSVLPEHAGARAGRREADGVGKVGYVFRDADIAPSMVVVGDRVALSQHEVTVDAFRGYWNAAGKARFGARLPTCRNREGVALFGGGGRNWEAPEFTQGGDHPVVCVSAAMAEHYAGWLSERTGQTYRLPKADELAGFSGSAKACAANVRDASYAKEHSARDAHSCDDGFVATSPVGRFRAAAPGLFDVDGNVSEWTGDSAGARGDERVVVGSSWHSEIGRPARKNFPADTAFNTIGIRLARDIPVTPPADS